MSHERIREHLKGKVFRRFGIAAFRAFLGIGHQKRRAIVTPLEHVQSFIIG